MSGAATNWTDLMAELAPDFDCAAVDLPGSGFSPPPAKRSGYSVSVARGDGDQAHRDPGARARFT